MRWTFGGAVTGGWPLGAFAGRAMALGLRPILDRLKENPLVSPVFFRLGSILRSPVTIPRLRAHYGAEMNAAALRRATVHPELGLVYNRIKKNANTTVVLMLRELEGHVVTDRRASKRSLTTLLELDRDGIAALAKHHHFLVVRHPFSRVLSAYLDKMREDKYRRKFGAYEATPEDFARFVTFLENGGLRRDAHWDLQTKLMLLPLARYDTVIRFESFYDDMMAMLKRLGLEPPEGRLTSIHPADKGKETKASEKLAAFYDAALMERVGRLFASDFEALGYERALPG